MAATDNLQCLWRLPSVQMELNSPSRHRREARRRATCDEWAVGRATAPLSCRARRRETNGDRHRLLRHRIPALAVWVSLLTLVATAQADPKVAFRVNGEGFRVGEKIRVSDVADGSIRQFMDDWLRESYPSWGPDGETLLIDGR